MTSEQIQRCGHGDVLLLQRLPDRWRDKDVCEQQHSVACILGVCTPQKAGPTSHIHLQIQANPHCMSVQFFVQLLENTLKDSELTPILFKFS